MPKFHLNQSSGISEDTLEWFKKLSLIQKLKCIEEQIKTLHFFRTLKPANGKIRNKNYRRKI